MIETTKRRSAEIEKELDDLREQQKTDRFIIQEIDREIEHDHLVSRKYRGDEEAAQRLAELTPTRNQMENDVKEREAVIADDLAELKTAKAAENADEERRRQAEITTALGKYYTECCAIDDAFQLLSRHVRAAESHLDRAVSFMTSEERTPLNQLRSASALTLACAHHDLAHRLSPPRWGIELGASATDYIHHQPYARYVAGFIDRWVRPREEAA